MPPPTSWRVAGNKDWPKNYSWRWMTRTSVSSTKISSRTLLCPGGVFADKDKQNWLQSDTTRHVRTHFTARRVCIAWTMPWQDVRLSVCPSVCHTPVFCQKQLHISSFIHHILLYQRKSMQNLTANTNTRNTDITGTGKSSQSLSKAYP